MARKALNLTNEDIAAALRTPEGDATPPILSPKQLADILNISVKTIYEWLAKGRLDGAFRKRGKHNLIWRDRAFDIIFNGKEW